MDELRLLAPYVGQAYWQLLGGLCHVFLSPHSALTLSLFSHRDVPTGLPSLLRTIPPCLKVVVTSYWHTPRAELKLQPQSPRI